MVGRWVDTFAELRQMAWMSLTMCLSEFEEWSEGGEG